MLFSPEGMKAAIKAFDNYVGITPEERERHGVPHTMCGFIEAVGEAIVHEIRTNGIDWLFNNEINKHQEVPLPKSLEGTK